MARRNIFQPPPPPDPPAPTSAASEDRPRFPNTGAMSGVKSTLRDLSSNAVREIDPAMIEDGGPRDRLSIAASDIGPLAESIRAHGQQVPIMVRPLPDRPGHYRIVYGRRRLHALRHLGIPAKALVRSLDDTQAILAQGQENSQRLDPSFIEKALFAADLQDGGYPVEVIADALATDRPMLSRMGKVARTVPREVIEAIGPAHGIGRRRWEELADLVREAFPDAERLLDTSALDHLASDDRFMAVLRNLQGAHKPAVPPPALRAVTHADGTRIAELRSTPRGMTIKLSASDAPEFTLWLAEHAETELTRLYEAWKAQGAG